MNTEELFGIQVANANMKEAAEYIGKLALNNTPCYVGGLNLNQLLLITNNKKMNSIYRNAGMVFPDGQPIVWMAKDLKRPLTAKLSGPDLVMEVCRVAAETSLSIYLLGGAADSPEKAGKILQEKYPCLNIAGMYSPPFGFEKDQKEMEKIINSLRDSNANILFVGLGSPKQDFFIADNMSEYKIPVSLSVGIAIDFIAGNTKRAPKWMRNCGLEWFHRMLQDPRRLMKRYLVDDIKTLKIYWKYKKSINVSK